VLDRRALEDLPEARLVDVEFTWGERAACAAATLEHGCTRPELLLALKAWAHVRGWRVTIAPLSRPG
jgi:hypothetical protein